MVHPKLNANCRTAVSQLRQFKILHQILILKNCRPAAFLACLIFTIFSIPHLTSAQIFESDENQFLEDDSQLPWVLEAEELIYDRQLDQYVARGNVKISKTDKKLTADFMRYDHKTQRVFADGNVVLTVGQDVLTGSQLEIDLENQTGSIDNAYLFLKENNFHIKANKIEKTGKNTYWIGAATLTTCDGDKPAWKIRGKDIKIKTDGSGTAKHATLWARNVPVLYTPFFYYPAKKDRQSGFLTPELGESKRLGYQYNQPFFWAISENTDATFYGHYMSNRGIKPGVEFRYILNERSKGTFMLDGFKDDKTDDGGQSSIDYGYSDAGEDVLRTNENRYWFRMSHHQSVPFGFFAKLDLDITRDQDYLRDFQEGYMGYEETNDHFLEFFHRQLDDYNDPIRTNRLNLNRIWPNFSFNFEPRWQDDTRHHINTNETLQRLPFISFDGAKQKILTSPFYFDLQSQYDYFWRDSGIRGQRLDVQPRFYLPFRVQNYLTIEPSVGLRETTYRLDKKDFEEEPATDRWSHRELFDTRLELFTEIEKVFNLKDRQLESIKHRIRPQVTHEFIPDAQQGDLPQFDAIDRIDETNKIIYALTNTLTSKSKIVEEKKRGPQLPISRGGQRDKTIDYRYSDFFRLKIEQSYDFEKAKRAFSPIFAKLDISPFKYVWIDADAQYSVYENELQGHNIQGSLWDRRGDELYVDYRYEKASEETEVEDDIQSINGKIKVQVTNQLSVAGEYEYNFENDQRIKTQGGFTYQAQCWSLDFQYTDEPNDWKIGFKIELIGLGQIKY